MGGRDRARGRADSLLHSAHYGQQRNSEIRLRCNSHGRHSELFSDHLAR